MSAARRRDELEREQLDRLRDPEPCDCCGGPGMTIELGTGRSACDDPACVLEVWPHLAADEDDPRAAA